MKSWLERSTFLSKHHCILVGSLPRSTCKQNTESWRRTFPPTSECLIQLSLREWATIKAGWNLTVLQRGSRRDDKRWRKECKYPNPKPDCSPALFPSRRPGFFLSRCPPPCKSKTFITGATHRRYTHSSSYVLTPVLVEGNAQTPTTRPAAPG